MKSLDELIAYAQRRLEEADRQNQSAADVRYWAGYLEGAMRAACVAENAGAAGLGAGARAGMGAGVGAGLGAGARAGAKTEKSKTPRKAQGHYRGASPKNKYTIKTIISKTEEMSMRCPDHPVIQDMEKYGEVRGRHLFEDRNVCFEDCRERLKKDEDGRLTKKEMRCPMCGSALEERDCVYILGDEVCGCEYCVTAESAGDFYEEI